MNERAPSASVVKDPADQTKSTATGVPAVVFVIGLLMETYGLYWVLAPASVTEGLLWIAGGLIIQVASGVHASRKHGLLNPLRVVTEEVRAIRRRVGTWDIK
jgi:hypothetical protein